MLTETYRPTTWADVIGQNKIVKRIDTLRPRGLAGRAYWISGQTGTGKTTIARLIAAEVASSLAFALFCRRSRRHNCLVYLNSKLSKIKITSRKLYKLGVTASKDYMA